MAQVALMKRSQDLTDMRVIPGDIIASEYDQFGSVRVYDDGNKRYLSFGQGDEQSCVIKATPHLLQYDYNRAMALVLLFCRLQVNQKPKDMLLLGMGGGSLINCLHYHFPQANIEVVELRETVIKVAKRYFYLPHSDKVKVTHGDALSLIDDYPAKQYDLLFSDLYIPEGLEARQLTVRFLASVKKVLKDDGFLVLNALEEYRTSQVLSSLFNQSFASIYECITKDGNWVVIATNNALFDNNEFKLKSLKADAKALSDELGFSILPQFKLLF